jgi:hypothetical protein
MQNVLERLERLERQNRRTKRIGLLALAALGTLVLMGQAAARKRTVEGEKFILVDAQGNSRATLATTSEPLPPEVAKHSKLPSIPRPSLEFFGSDGKLESRLEGSKLSLYDTRGERLSLQGGANAWAIHFYDSRGDAAVILGEADGPFLSLRDEEGYQATLGTSGIMPPRTSAASLILFGKDGKVLWRAP